MKQVLMPVPSYGFDPTESSIPWRILKNAGFGIVFSTPEGRSWMEITSLLVSRVMPIVLDTSLRDYLKGRPDEV
jgi:hypothetical protein